MESLKKVGKELGGFQSLKYFYSSVKSPCDQRRGLCPRVKVVEGFWNWRYAENKGAAWSLFAKSGDNFRLPFLIGVSIAAVFFIINFVRKLEPEQKLLMWALSLICGGAIGNLIDRVYLGYVIDFIDWYIGRSHWPTFNVADAAISTGVGLILLSMIQESLQKKKDEEPSVAQH